MILAEAERLLDRLHSTPNAKIHWMDDADQWPRWIEKQMPIWEMRVFTLRSGGHRDSFRLQWERMQTDHGMYGDGEQRISRAQALGYLTLGHMAQVGSITGGTVKLVDG